MPIKIALGTRFSYVFRFSSLSKHKHFFFGCFSLLLFFFSLARLLWFFSLSHTRFTHFIYDILDLFWIENIQGDSLLRFNFFRIHWALDFLAKEFFWTNTKINFSKKIHKKKNTRHTEKIFPLFIFLSSSYFSGLQKYDFSLFFLRNYFFFLFNDTDTERLEYINDYFFLLTQNKILCMKNKKLKYSRSSQYFFFRFFFSTKTKFNFCGNKFF